MKKGLVSLLLAVMMLSFTACGSANKTAAESSYAAESAPRAAAKEAINYGDLEMEEAAADDSYYDADTAAGSEGGSAEPETVEQGSKKSNRKLITTVNISAESDDVEALAERIENKVEGLGGYVESGNVYSDNSRYGNKIKSADITARIPADRLKDFLNDVEGHCNILSRSENTQDVTLQYADTEAHERALTLEQQSLERMLGMAETVDDIMAIQSQLTDVRYRLDSIRSQLRTYDNDVNYSTVYISLTETQEYTPTEEETVWQRISNGFVDNLMEVMDAVAEFLIWFITHIPALFIFGLIVLVLVIVIRRIAASGKKGRVKNAPVNKNGQVAANNSQVKPDPENRISKAEDRTEEKNTDDKQETNGK